MYFLQYNDLGDHVFGELDSEGAPGYWSLQARFFDAGGVEVGLQEAISVTNPGHAWTRINGIVTKPISATTMRVELVSQETSGWVTFDDIFVLKAPSPLIPPPPTSVKYYYFGGQRVAMRRTNHDTDESTLHYLHADHLGSTRLVTDENGDAISSQGYFAFGSERSGGPIPTDHSFTGQKVDRSGLLYYNARYYDPVLGVFVSPDTIVPDPENVFAYNRYMYVFGNPLRMSDPSGHVPCESVNGTCAGRGGRAKQPSAVPTAQPCVSIVCNPTPTQTQTWAEHHAATVTPTPSPTPEAYLNQGSPPTATPTSIPLGSPNWTDTYISTVVAVTYGIPEALGEGSIWIRATGRTAGNVSMYLVPVGIVASVAPNAISHYQNGDPGTEIAIDLVTDMGGVAGSFASGKVIGGLSFIGAVFVNPAAAPVAYGVGDAVGSFGGSIIYDVWAGPTLVRPYVSDGVNWLWGN